MLKRTQERIDSAKKHALAAVLVGALALAELAVENRFPTAADVHPSEQVCISITSLDTPEHIYADIADQGAPSDAEAEARAQYTLGDGECDDKMPVVPRHIKPDCHVYKHVGADTRRIGCIALIIPAPSAQPVPAPSLS